MSQFPPPPPGFQPDPPPAGFVVDQPRVAPPPPPGFAPDPPEANVPANFALPTQGDVDPRMLELARSMPGTQFDFSDYNQTDATGGRQQLPTLTPEQQARQTGFEQLVGRVTSTVNDPRNPVGRAADQLLIEDANVTPIEAAGGYQQRGAQLKREALDRTPRAVRPIATGFLQSGLSSAALLGQVTDAITLTEGAADLMNRETAELSENRRSLGTSMFEDAAEGVTRSITDLFTLGGPTFLPGPKAGAFARRMAQAAPAISAFTAKAMNDAEYRGSEAGLSGGDLASYVLTQGAIEGATTAVFSAVGLGGFENLKQGAKTGVRQALTQFGVQTISELGEENLIGLMSAVSDVVSGVDPEATSPERLKELVAETSLATLMTMGLAQGSQRALHWSRGRQQNNLAKAKAVEAESDRGTRNFGPVHGPQQLALPTQQDIAERKVTDARAGLKDAEARLAAEQAALAQQPAGEGTISVDPQGRAATPEQQAQVDQSTQSITTPQVDLQPAQGSPQADEAVRRDQAVTDAVTEEADALIADMRTRGDVSEADEARIRQLVNEARRNPLTGGMNRNAFSKVFDTLRARARKSKKPMSIIAIDAKNLKIYNDQISESAGDEYLRRAQRVLESALRGSDEGRDRIGDAFHYGGDEWAIVLPDTDAKGAEIVRDRIEQAFGSKEIVPGVSDGLVGGIVEVNPNSRKVMRSFLDDAVKAMKARKTEQKRAAGEATTREEAEARAAQAPTPPPVAVTRRSTAGVRDAAANVARAKREVERTQAAVEQIKVEQELNANEPGSFDPNDTNALADAVLPVGTPPVLKQSLLRQWLSRKITPMGYSLERWAPRLYARVKQFERHWRTDRNDADKFVHEFEQQWKGKEEQYARYMYYRHTGQTQEARQYLQEQFPDNHIEMHQAAEEVKAAADNWYAQLVEAKGDMGYLEHHFPGRSVRSDKFDEFMESRHGPEATDDLVIAIRREEKKRGRPLSPDEKVEVSNRLLINGRPPVRPGTTSPRMLGQRTVEDLDFETYQTYYDTTIDSVYRYFDTVIYNTHKARLFGKDSADADIDETIGRMFVEGKYGLDKLTPYQKNRIRSILMARFTAGEQGAGALGRGLRDIGYGTLLADPFATVVQFGDIMQTGVRDGVIPAISSIPAAIRERFLTAKALGLDHISDTYGDVNWLSKLLRKGLTVSGFRAVDNSFLTVGMVSAKRAAQKKLRTKKGEQAFRRTWQRYYDPAALDTLVRDLKADTPSDMVADFAYMRASEVRPMDHFDAPQSYVAHPKLRIFWQMKQFAIKQFSLVRRQGWDKIARGIRTNDTAMMAEGSAGLLRAMMLLGLAGAATDWLRDWIWGRDPDFSDSLVNSLLYTHLGSTYLFGAVGKDGPGGAAWNLLSPPVFSQVDDVWKSAVDGKQTWWRTVPVIGNTAYSFTQESEDKSVRRMRQEALDKAREAHLKGDVAGRNAYIQVFNEQMKDLGRDDRLSALSVRRSAERQKETDE